MICQALRGGFARRWMLWIEPVLAAALGGAPAPEFIPARPRLPAPPAGLSFEVCRPNLHTYRSPHAIIFFQELHQADQIMHRIPILLPNSKGEMLARRVPVHG
jgi:hypothetical protein